MTRTRFTRFDFALAALAIAFSVHAILNSRESRSAADVLLAQAACREAAVQLTLADGIEALIKGNPQIPRLEEEYAKAGLRRERAMALIARECPEAAHGGVGQRSALRD